MTPSGTMRAVFYKGARHFAPGKTAIPAAGPLRLDHRSGELRIESPLPRASIAW